MIVIPLENCSNAGCQHGAIRAITPHRARTDIFPRRVERVEVVEVGEGAEELLGAAHLVADDDAALARALDLEHLDDGPVALLDGPHHALVDLERVLARLLQEDRVRHRADVRLAVGGIKR